MPSTEIAKRIQRLRRVVDSIVGLDLDRLSDAELRETVAAIQERGKRATEEVPRGNRTDMAAARTASAKRRAEQATRFHESLRPIIEKARREGAVSARQVAEHLNALHIEPMRGGEWTADKAAYVMRKLEQL